MSWRLFKILQILWQLFKYYINDWFDQLFERAPSNTISTTVPHGLSNINDFFKKTTKKTHSLIWERSGWYMSNKKTQENYKSCISLDAEILLIFSVTYQRAFSSSSLWHIVIIAGTVCTQSKTWLVSCTMQRWTATQRENSSSVIH